MSFTHTYTETWSGAGRSVQAEKSFTAASQTSLKETIADGLSDIQHFIAIDISTLKSIFIKSDRDIKLDTNNAAPGVDTINIKANVPYTWNTDKVDALKLTADVTSIFVENLSGALATLEIEVLQDPTP